MKRVYLLLLCWSLVRVTMAQSQYRQAADNAFASLDKSGITSGTLYDRVFPAANLRQTDAPSSAGHFQQAQAELYNASYNTNDRLTPDDLSSLLWQSRQNGITPIGVLISEFQTLNFDAVELNGNNQYQLRGGYNNGQLYQTRQAVVASILSTSVGLGTSQFQIPIWGVYSHNNPAITSVQINFGDGGPVRTLTPGNATTSIFYGSLGERTVQYVITLADGSQRTASSKLTVAVGNGGGFASGPAGTASPGVNAVTADYREPDPRDGLGRIERLSIESDQSFQGYEETYASPGKGNAYFYYAQGRDQLRKPVIILDGFDATDARGPVEIYGTRLRYVENGQDKFLGNELRTNDPARRNEPDYNSDLVILNFPQYTAQCYTKTICIAYFHPVGCVQQNQVTICPPRDGGVDYIERNALVLVKLINIVNQRLQASGSTEKITLIGPSMGGLISRYALRYMEQNGMNANCKLWVSFDSPHNGANIPIGGQQFLEYFANGLGIKSAKDALNQQIDSPAAQQMLIHHYKNGEAVGGSPNFRNRWVNTLNSIGYPQASCLRKVSLVNGSKNGVLQPFGACQEALNLNARLTDASTVTCLGFGLILGLICLSGRDRLLDAKIYTAPSGLNRCLTMRKTLTAYGLGSAERYAVGSRTGQPSNDLLPGGYYDVLGVIADESRDKNWFYRINVNTYFQKASFIPTVSSYGLYDTNRNWGASLANINKTTETPFADIFAPDENEDHTFLSVAGVNFVRAQVGLANQQPCNGGSCDFNISANTVNANCNQQVTLTANCVGNNCDGITYTWSGNGLNQNGQSVTFNAPGTDGNFTYTVTANQSNCTAKTVTGTVNVGGCGGGTCTFTQPRRVGTWNGLDVQIRQYGGKIVLVTAIPGSTTDKHYPRGDNFWNTFTKDANVDQYQACLNGGNTDFGGLVVPGGLSAPPGYVSGTESDGAFYFQQGNQPPNCDFTIGANSPSVNCNAGVTLSANCTGANCDNITYAWGGNGLNQNGQSVTFNAPGSNGNFTYTVTATRPGCGSRSANATVTVSGCTTNPPTGQSCQEAETATGTGNVLSGGNASGGQYKASYGVAGEYVVYTLSVPSAGSYTLKLGAASLENPTAGVIVNGGGLQPLPIGNTGGWENFAERSISVSLQAGQNSIRVQGGSGGAFRQDKLCIDGGIVDPPGNEDNPADGSYEGFFDNLDCGSAGGWVWNSSYPNRPIVIEFVEGGSVVGTVTAGNFRQDLVNAGKGDGNHGFEWLVPASLRNGQNRSVSVRVKGRSYVLNNSPRTITCSGGGRLGSGAPEVSDGLVVSPNPNEGRLRVRFGTVAGMTYKLRIVDMQGRALQSWSVLGRGGLHDEPVDVVPATVGTVLVVLEGPGRRESQKVILLR